jgi:hypothetical protein
MWCFYYLHIERRPESFEQMASAMYALDASCQRLLASAREVLLSIGSFGKATEEYYRQTQSACWQERDRFLDQLIDQSARQTASKSSSGPADWIRRAVGWKGRWIRAAEKNLFWGIVVLLATTKRSPLDLPEPFRRSSRGRPPSVVADGQRALIWHLLSAVDKAGGKLTFNKNHETSGTRALYILAPCLPNGFKVIPRDVAAEIYRKWKKKYRSEDGAKFETG